MGSTTTCSVDNALKLIAAARVLLSIREFAVAAAAAYGGR